MRTFRVKTSKEITFKDFQKLMMRRGRTVDDLIDLFRGKIDDPRDFFEGVMSCQWRNPETRRFEDRSAVVIPYRSVIEFYLKEKFYLEAGKRSVTADFAPPGPAFLLGNFRVFSP